MMARSRSSGNKGTAAAAGSAAAGTRSPDLFAAEDAEHLAANTAANVINHDDPTTYNNIFENSPPRGVFSAASWPKAAAAAGSSASGSNQCGGRSSHRGRREENFHAAMDNRLVYMAFSSFCNKNLSSENVEFVLQVREVNQLLEMEETTAGDLREKLRQVAVAFVNPNSATEVNVKGSTRASALCAIGAALEAAGHDGCCCCGGGGGGGGRGSAGKESCCPGTSCAWALAEEAIEALARLAEEVHSVIFDGLWPRFLVSEEFHAMMNIERRRYSAAGRKYAVYRVECFVREAPPTASAVPGINLIRKLVGNSLSKAVGITSTMPWAGYRLGGSLRMARGRAM
ncbi:hypothetical protein Esi_0103_0078 [Ectocarpus siliculosus]|uniref:RGS domain-containing protein n=1 Tax=Ectocarpus siliculosus TaxID=2880 RepID=D8LCH8_ECTSI|nr:hypothetical protein Esi_0103_0078 [Ectocarpus siliculosus]|eukprot:CBN78214.1 hypothetical protein Esi_0103_0078 [Ectocarpus siliculosus]